MPGQTKLIIVTANEDLIRQIAFNTSLQAQVIDLDNKQQPSSTTTTTMNSKDINMAILAKLFQPVCITLLLSVFHIIQLYFVES